ncbi:MAG: polysaccharide lyase family protein [Terriglobia bacterium]
MAKFGVRVILALAVFGCTLSIAAPKPPTGRGAGNVTGARSQTVWQIGKFDQSSHEFNGGIDLRNPSMNPVFIVGRSNPALDWPEYQPGSLNKSAGGHPHPYTISFHLPGRPKGVYRLKISMILNHSRVPNLQAAINGHSGMFYLYRHVSYYPGDGGVDSPIYGDDTIEIDLPSSYLRAGDNDLVLTAIDDPKLGPGDSWLNYDALELTNDPGAKEPRAPEVMVRPTVFYTNSGGQLRELADVFVTLNARVKSGNVALIVGKEQFRAPLSTAADFGQQRFEFAIPELAAPTPARVVARVNGRSHESEVTLTPQRKWTLFVAPHAHLDIGYTDFQAKVAEVHNRNVDKLLNEIDAHPEMRFSLDGSWIVRQYLASRNKQARGRFLADVRDGKIAVPAELANLMTGYPTLEELIRSTAYTYRLHRKDGIPFDYANITDVPSYPWSYASVLHALGLKYFLAASNNDRAPILLYGRWNEKSPFWWQGPDGHKVLMSYSRQYFQLSFVCGVPAQVAACRQSLPTFLQQYEAPSYKPDVVLMYGSQVENTDLIPGEPEFVKSWNSRYAYPKMVLTAFPDYMRYIDQHYGSELETVVGGFGPYWEDGYGTDVHFLTIDRSSQQRAPSAEKLSTIATYLHKNVSGPRGQIQQMWNDLVLYAEHTFTSWGGYSRPESEETVRQFATKDQYAVDGRERVNHILDQAFSQLAYKIHVPAPAIVVFNSLNWTRSGLVETDLNHGEEIVAYPGLKPVPLEIIAHHPDFNHVRFLARGVPSLGYRCYQIVSVHGHPAAPEGETVLPVSNTIENSYYRVTIDPQAGAISSIYDKQLQRELVDSSSPYHFNQYLYVSGGDGATQIVYMQKSLPLARLTVNTSHGGRVTSVRKTSYGEILTYQTSGAEAPSIETQVMLFDHQKKIELINRIRKEPVNHKEAIYFAFPVAAPRPEFSYEIQNGSVDPARNLLKGANVAWFTVQHWVKAASPGVSVAVVPIDSPLVTLGDINRGTWPDAFDPKSSTIFSYALNNYWHTNFRRVQSGDFTFRYVITSGRQLTPQRLARVGRDAMTPVEIAQVISNDKFGNPPEPLSPNPASFLQVDASDVVVVDWKSAYDGHGTIVRLLETGGESTTAHLTFPLFEINQAWQTNAVEEDQTPLTVSGHSVAVSLTPHEIATLRIVGKKL